ncbi:glycosyltransferase family 2 protein [Hymenobacter sp. BT491]|uniref:glycosyltransferase family 2 protein n=1 Tax=Hymenobacter sp. BT491 TaxID=2766779 RepID=UPI00165368DD|nr:glycosyltransferase family A protein [Hymenobacter sp. BT491]MBC6989716.1 glycosyltransferase family 2 protein [Hymenobacter sp. BT491]
MHFSVITPTHNRRQFLPEAVASVRASITAPLDITFEQLICENGSTDDTATWLREAAKQDGAPVRYWSQKIKSLPGPARNTVIKHAPAEAWLVPLDDDDIMLQRNLFHYADLIQQSANTQWFVADFLRMDQERRYLPGEDYYAWRFDSPTDMLRAIFKAEHFIQGNVCYSHKLFEEVGGYDETLPMAEDLDLYVRFLLAGHQPVISPHISHLHRFHTSNISVGVDADKHGNDLREIYDRYAQELGKQGIERP